MQPALELFLQLKSFFISALRTQGRAASCIITQSLSLASPTKTSKQFETDSIRCCPPLTIRQNFSKAAIELRCNSSPEATAIIAFSTRTLWKITSILLAKTVCPLSVNSRYCFGTEDPILRPTPAAGITTKTLPLVIIYFQVRSFFLRRINSE